jgi:hypothetical protein
MHTTETNQESELELNAWLNSPGGSNVITPEPEGGQTTNPGFFQRPNDLSFLNRPEVKPAKEEGEKPAGNTGAVPADGDKGKEDKTKNAAPQLSPEALKELNDIVNPASIAGDPSPVQLYGSPLPAIQRLNKAPH